MSTILPSHALPPPASPSVRSPPAVSSAAAHALIIDTPILPPPMRNRPPTSILPHSSPQRIAAATSGISPRIQSQSTSLSAQSPAARLAATKLYSPRQVNAIQLDPNANEFNPTIAGAAVTSMSSYSPQSPAMSLNADGVSPLPHSPTLTPSRRSHSHSLSSPNAIGNGNTSAGRSPSPSLNSATVSGTSLSPSSLNAQAAAHTSALLQLQLPAEPRDPRESDRQVAAEKADHAAYLFGFRVAICPHFSTNECPYDAYTCFHAHARTPRRRKPLLQVGRFNYIPTRCRYISDEKECPQGIHCRFAHVTEEIIYHPSKYKTQLCAHTVDTDGNCIGYGRHCAKAHGMGDLRQPIFEHSDDAPPPIYTLLDRFDFTVTEPERDIERRYYMFVYKTKRCEGFPYNCNCDGLDYHRDEERRRGPLIAYAPIACPNVKPYLNSEWGPPNIDCSGKYKSKILKNGSLIPQRSDIWECEYAHTMLEIMYHPSVYKSGLCDHFDENDCTTWKCVWKRRCAHAHGKEDCRTKEDAMEDWKLHLRQILPPHSQAATMTRLLHPAGPLAVHPNGQTFASPLTPTSASPHQLPMGARAGHHSRSASQPVELNSFSLNNMNITTNPLNRPLHTAMTFASNQQKSPLFAHANVHSPSLHHTLHARGSSASHLSNMASPPNVQQSPTRDNQPPAPHHRRPHSLQLQPSSAQTLRMMNSGKLGTDMSPQSSSPSPNIKPALSLYGGNSVWSDSATSASSSNAPLNSIQSSPPHRPSETHDDSIIVSGWPNDQRVLTRVNSHRRAATVASPYVTFNTEAINNGSGVGLQLDTINSAGSSFPSTNQPSPSALLPSHLWSTSPSNAGTPASNETIITSTTKTTTTTTTSSSSSLMNIQEAILSNNLSFTMKTRLIYHLFECLYDLHQNGITHGNINPQTIIINLDLSNIQLINSSNNYNNSNNNSDNINNNDNNNIYEDIDAAINITYFILTSHNLISYGSIWSQHIQQHELNNLSPLAINFIISAIQQINTQRNLIINNNNNNLIQNILIHPFFWSPIVSLHYICIFAQAITSTISPLINREQIISQMKQQTISFASSSAGRATPLHPVLNSIMERITSSTHANYDTTSVRLIPLITLIAHCVDMISQTNQQTIDCDVHNAFNLLHLPTCAYTRAQAASPSQTTNSSSTSSSLSSVDLEMTMNSVAFYFLSRFPSLIITLYTMIPRQWTTNALFTSFYTYPISTTQHLQALTQSFSLPHPAPLHISDSSASTATPITSLSSAHRSSPSKVQVATLAAANNDNNNNINIIQQLQQLITCPFTTSVGPTHTLVDPISTSCCGMSMCRACIDAYISSVINAPNVHSYGACVCGYILTEENKNQLHLLPQHQITQALITLYKRY